MCIGAANALAWRTSFLVQTMRKECKPSSTMPGMRHPRSIGSQRRNPMPTTVLNLTDLDNIIRRFEKAYNVTSVAMLKDETVRSKISEDALLRWETYVEQRVRLRDLSE